MSTLHHHSLTLPVRGLDLHAHTAGEGTPVLLLHGYPDTSALWLPLMDAIGANYACVAPDLPGFGQTAAPPDFDYSLDGMASFIDALVDQWKASTCQVPPVYTPA